MLMCNHRSVHCTHIYGSEIGGVTQMHHQASKSPGICDIAVLCAMRSDALKKILNLDMMKLHEGCFGGLVCSFCRMLAVSHILVKAKQTELSQREGCGKGMGEISS